MIHEQIDIDHARNPRIAAALRPRALRYAHIAGWGMALPSHVMPNSEFERLVDTTDEWIYTKTGIRERRIAEKGETATHLAIRAAQEALGVAGMVAGDIDLIIVATSTPEYLFPSTASMVQDLLGATNAGASDVSAACSGFVYAFDLAVNKIRTGSVGTALVIGAETMSRVLDWTDRKTCVLFGDGAGAVIVKGSDTPGGVLSSVLHSDGSGWDLLTLPTVGSQETYLKDGEHQMHRITMNGRAVFEFATRAMAEGVQGALSGAGLGVDDLDLLIPHQANQRILDAAVVDLQIAPEKVFSNLEYYGNTSAASIPIALSEAANTGRLQPGDILGLVGFGGGLSWGAAVVEWTGPSQKELAALGWERRQPQVVVVTLNRPWQQITARVRATAPRLWRLRSGVMALFTGGFRLHG
ncbi:MAG TPA: beta-ketoacyl-ACP synthase III [Aggregatilineaceae bacterium]|nr:beta-ketoacyl-ACP synthase III [Aggregatilineaceae bacterium]